MCHERIPYLLCALSGRDLLLFSMMCLLSITAGNSFTCLLHYLHGEESRKCPMCSDITRRSHIRGLLQERELYAQHTAPIATSKRGRVAGGIGSGVVPNQKASFALLLCRKGCISPILPEQWSMAVRGHTQHQYQQGDLSTLIPSYNSPNACYCRLNTASPSQLISMMTNRLERLEMYRALCLKSATMLSAAGEGGDEVVGDVEYLPFFPEAEEILQNQIRELSAATGDVVCQDEVCSEVNDGNKTSDRERVKGRDEDRVELTAGVRADCVWMYQHTSGRAIFLHPLCVRCLQQQAERDGQGGGIAGVTVVSADPTNILTGGHSSGGVSPVDGQGGNAAGVMSHGAVEESPPESSATASMYLPRQLLAVVLEVESHVVSEENRRRFPFVRHLPLDCPFLVVEVDMRGVVDDEVYKK